jgi:hypothetical protein
LHFFPEIANVDPTTAYRACEVHMRQNKITRCIVDSLEGVVRTGCRMVQRAVDRVQGAMIEKKTLLADMIFWTAVTLPVVIFLTAKIANYALKRAKRGRAEP